MRLALLACGVFPPHLQVLHGDYNAIFNNFFSDACHPHTFTLDTFDATALQYPPDHDLDKYNAVVVSGSRTAASAYEDIEWINKLTSYIARIVDAKPSIKIIGICFGHQIVARAMGAQVVRNGDRWEVGPTLVNLTGLGRAIFGVDSFHIQEMHRDHVPSLPAGFHLLGSTHVSRNQGMVHFYQAGNPERVEDVTTDDIHILTLQGHPEFTEPIVTSLIEARAATGVIDTETAADGLERRYWPNDGVSVIGRSIWGVIGIKVESKN